MDLPETTCGIGEFSQCFGASFRTLRYYEQLGLLRPARVGRTRYFSEQDYHRMTFVEEGKSFGLSLDQIITLLNGRDTSKPVRDMRIPREMIKTRIVAIERQRADLDRKLAKLKAIRAIVESGKEGGDLERVDVRHQP